MTTPSYKDYFSKQSMGYSQYRPDYPGELFRYLAGLVVENNTVWDCATGTGQAARGLAAFFQRVIATDASDAQIQRFSSLQEGISARVASAEDSGIEPQSVDLIVVAQALHWFDLERFYREVRRVLKPGGVIAVWSYATLSISPELDEIIGSLYRDVLGPYWPAERRLVETGYRELDFPFDRVEPPAFAMRCQWSLPHLLGYIETWSAMQRYRDIEGVNPLVEFAPKLQGQWGADNRSRAICWPLTMKVGRC
ncbi:class I SAM-dependent methyltransferase [Halieaceae bacterium IMCC8485]|uniref:Class I SAM-dependent methyltransferase n=1 Tax=Candidatus Seongchinamella marina TaxID=2518990 RepID=A0ABT3T0F1_9GAMM|nr:class I SAM-dependent methyltransferase [Candidatus Seongchinamella marina]MCX2975731.1 class I SAM-dependent methyltransferase [Candidatus Seongchinamella marina]